MMLHSNFVQPKYCPYALKQYEADVLLTEKNYIKPDEWSVFVNCCHVQKGYENHIYAGLHKDLVALAEKTKGDIFWDNDARDPIRSTGFYLDTQGSEILRWETPNWYGLSQPQKRIVIASNATRGTPTNTHVVTVRATDGRGPWAFKNLAVVWQ